MLYKGDCLQIMPELVDQGVKIDMILCDLPYGVTAMDWDKKIPIDKLWEQYERLIKPNGAIVLFAQQPYTSLLITSNIKRFRHTYCWIKNLKTNFLQANKMPMRGHENIIVFGLNMPNYYPIMKNTKWNTTGGQTLTEQYKTKRRKQVKRNGECLPDDVLYFNCIHGSKKRFHKNQKPVPLFEHLIKTYTNEGDLVLDNCAGSGTTAIACMNTNRKYICIEQDDKYFQIMQDRIKNHVIQTELKI